MGHFPQQSVCIRRLLFYGYQHPRPWVPLLVFALYWGTPKTWPMMARFIACILLEKRYTYCMKISSETLSRGSPQQQIAKIVALIWWKETGRQLQPLNWVIFKQDALSPTCPQPWIIERLHGSRATLTPSQLRVCKWLKQQARKFSRPKGSANTRALQSFLVLVVSPTNYRSQKSWIIMKYHE